MRSRSVFLKKYDLEITFQAQNCSGKEFSELFLKSAHDPEIGSFSRLK
jgi:hypothetical protein